jgi:hypothetical protein
VKKIVVILLLFIYGSATMGATIHLHYCMDVFVGSSLWHNNKDDKCGKCGMKEKKGGCCKDEHKQFKLKTDHQKSGIAQYVKIFDTPALTSPITEFDFKGSLLLAFSVSNGPPEIPRKKLCILHCVFLI